MFLFFTVVKVYISTPRKLEKYAKTWKEKKCVCKQVRSDVRRHGIGEVSLVVTGGSDARNVGRAEGCGPEGARQGTSARFDFFLRLIFSAVGSVGIPFLPGFVIYRGEKLVYAWEERNICTRYWTVRNSADVPITKWRDISWSAGDARAWSGINPVQDSGTIRRFLARISGRVHAEESRSRARGSIRQRYRRPVNNGREFALEGEPEQLHVRLRASESDAGVLWRK